MPYRPVQVRRAVQDQAPQRNPTAVFLPQTHLRGLEVAVAPILLVLPTGAEGTHYAHALVWCAGAKGACDVFRLGRIVCSVEPAAPSRAQRVIQRMAR